MYDIYVLLVSSNFKHGGLTPTVFIKKYICIYYKEKPTPMTNQNERERERENNFVWSTKWMQRGKVETRALGRWRRVGILEPRRASQSQERKIKKKKKMEIYGGSFWTSLTWSLRKWRDFVCKWADEKKTRMHKLSIQVMFRLIFDSCFLSFDAMTKKLQLGLDLIIHIQNINLNYANVHLCFYFKMLIAVVHL